MEKMPNSYTGVVIFLLLGASVLVSGTADAAKSLRAAKARLRSSYSSWRIVVCLTQPQTPFKTDVQKAWEAARLESLHADMDVSYIEARMTPMTDSLSYPLSLLTKFCTDIEGGKTVLSLIIGGGSTARFLVTATAALKLPVLWLPFTHRDFLRQVHFYVKFGFYTSKQKLHDCKFVKAACNRIVNFVIRYTSFRVYKKDIFFHLVIIIQPSFLLRRVA